MGTFSSLICIKVIKLKNVQNAINSAKDSSIFSGNDGVYHNIQQKAIYFADNLTCLIVTGYAMIIMNVLQNKEDYIQCLSNLCLAHPNFEKKSMPKSIQSVQKDENLKKAMMMIYRMN